MKLLVQVGRESPYFRAVLAGIGKAYCLLGHCTTLIVVHTHSLWTVGG